MFRILFAALRSKAVWLGIGVVTAAGAAFVYTVAFTTAVAIAVRGDEVDPDAVAEVATPLGLLAAVATLAGVPAAWRAVRRARVRRWMSIR
jgi:hypothetical protein